MTDWIPFEPELRAIDPLEWGQGDCFVWHGRVVDYMKAEQEVGPIPLPTLVTSAKYRVVDNKVYFVIEVEKDGDVPMWGLTVRL